MVVEMELLDAKETQSRLVELIAESAQIRIGVYSAQESGLLLTETRLRHFLENGGSLTILFGFRTSLGVFERLSGLEKEYGKPIQIGLYTRQRFHSKIYVFTLKDGSVTSIVGSSNFTEPALSRNIETNVQVKNGVEVQPTLDKYFEEAKKDRKEIKKILQKLEKANQAADRTEDKLEHEYRVETAGKDARAHEEEMFLELLKRIQNYDFKQKLESAWEEIDNLTDKKFKSNTRSGKKAWTRKRLNFALREIILGKDCRMNESEEMKLFRLVGDYTFQDSAEVKSEYLFRTKFFKDLASIIKNKKLEREFSRAAWANGENKRKLFGKLAKYLRE